VTDGIEAVAVVAVGAAFGGVAMYGLITGRLPVRVAGVVRRAEHPLGYWTLIVFYLALAGLAFLGVISRWIVGGVR
jgi:hypothetical protein